MAPRKKITCIDRLYRVKKEKQSGRPVTFFSNGGALPEQSKSLIEWRHAPYVGD